MERPTAMHAVTLALLAGIGCATGDASSDGDRDDLAARADAGEGRVDAGPRDDAGPQPDAAAGAVDAAIGPADAAVALPDAADGCTVQTVNLLSNPGFDAGVGGGWAETSSGGFELIVPSTDPGLGGNIAADTAPNLAWLGGGVDLDDDLSQDVLVPAGTTALVLRGRRWLTTTETATVTFDTLRVSLRSGAGVLLEELASFSNLDDTTGWVDVEVAIAAPHAGEVVRLDLAAHNDFSDHTNFFVDSLSLKATTCD